MDNGFRVDNTAYVTFWPSSALIGQIVSIGINGLTFDYPRGREKPANSGKLNLSWPQENFHLREVPFQIVSDAEAQEVTSSTWDLRRCEIEFGELAYPLKSKLEDFIQSFTISA
jgi:hypothetical protein